MAKKTTTWSEYRAETVHLIGGKEIKKKKDLSAVSAQHAQELFRRMRIADPTIREAVLFHAATGARVDQFLGNL